eukprot:768810-Hanusia_phi.AAC.21
MELRMFRRMFRALKAPFTTLQKAPRQDSTPSHPLLLDIRQSNNVSATCSEGYIPQMPVSISSQEQQTPRVSLRGEERIIPRMSCIGGWIQPRNSHGPLY